MMIAATTFVFLLAAGVADSFTESIHFSQRNVAVWPKLSGRTNCILWKGISYPLFSKEGADASSANMTGKGTSDAFQRALLEARLEMEKRRKANNDSRSLETSSDKDASEKRRELLQRSLLQARLGLVRSSTSVKEILGDDGKGDTNNFDAPDPTPPQENADTMPERAFSNKKAEKKKLIRSEGGIFAFDTKFGALNPFAIYYGLVSIALGIIWFAALSLCDIFYIITGNRVDPLRRLPVFINHVWGTLLMRFSRSYPKMENRDVLMDFYKQNRAAMFVANHNSWMDIPFMGATIGWRNYKMVAKKELEKVPILGRAIKCAKNVSVDRSDRRSQLFTLKAGMQWLKDGVHLCTFPEGTRSKTGRVIKFKNGAFKMAHKVGAPVIPLSIVASGKVMPSHWLFPCRPSRGIAKVVVHEPIESEGKTEDELATAARDAIISGLPDDQRPKV